MPTIPKQVSITRKGWDCISKGITMDIKESRFQRLEDKVDRVENKVIEVGSKLDTHMEVVKDHIAGDKKVINEWKPVIEMVPHLKEIIDNHNYEKERNRRWKNTLMITATIVGIIAGLSRVFMA